jgi:hypothetical protein
MRCFRFLLVAAATFLSVLVANSSYAKPLSTGAATQVASAGFGVPFPKGRNALDWQQRRRLMEARSAAGRMRRNAVSANAATAPGMIETIAGSAPFQGPITALKAGLGGMGGVVEDAQGNVYIAEAQFGTVLKVDTASNITVYAGMPLPTGPAVQSGDGGPAVAAQLPAPEGLSLDSAGNLYVADEVTETVRRVDAKSGVISNLIGTPGETERRVALRRWHGGRWTKSSLLNHV